MPELPTGTVTFLFTDIEGSTRLLRELGEDYGALQDEHARIIRAAVASEGGVEVRTIGDAFFVVFPTAAAALRAAAAAQRALAPTAWRGGQTLRVRMGLHTGEGELGGDDYLGVDVNRTARIAAAGHGGQVLLSEATRVLGTNDLPEGVTVRDLGPHRLKDFAEPQAIHQLVIDGLPADFPPLRTLDVPTNLPPDLTSFVGRADELLAVEQALEASRLVTLTGPGGSGKTRLALRAAADLAEHFPGGVFFVDLSAITEARLVPDAIAEAVGTGEQGPRSVLETLGLELRDRTMLLVLDNLEQVLDAAPWIGTLLATLPKLRVLATSRGPLRIRGEHELPIPPLGLPAAGAPIGPEDAQGFEAVRLFLDRATAIDPGFTLTPQNAPAVVEICRRLDGLPLAIELAASRLRILAPEAMLERLDRALPWLGGTSRDLPARQRTLRGAIGWSYDLLSESVATLFRRLCVFAGGCSLDAATAVGDPEGELEVDPLDGVEALLDGGLLRRRTTPGGEIRFDTLQTVREFGLERLAEAGEGPAIRDRHAAYLLASAEAAEPDSRGPELPRVAVPAGRRPRQLPGRAGLGGGDRPGRSRPPAGSGALAVLAPARRPDLGPGVGRTGPGPPLGGRPHAGPGPRTERGREPRLLAAGPPGDHRVLRGGPGHRARARGPGRRGRGAVQPGLRAIAGGGGGGRRAPVPREPDHLRGPG